MPFFVLGKDMRALTGAAMREPECKIPRAWLKSVNHKSYFYAQHQTQIISGCNKNNDDADSEAALSAREAEVLHDLYDGLSKPEIAAKQSLSINTVKAVAKNIYEKLNARNIADLVRIAAELKLIR
jgi:DNA-binding NarL/FixJ family response regulator